MVLFPISGVLRGFQQLLGFGCQVSGVSKQMTEDRKQKSDKVLHLPIFSSVFCRLASAIQNLTPEH
jgi:hypothetical protein